MTSVRRADLLRVVEKLNLPIIEDNVYGFFDNAELAMGFIVAPQRLCEGCDGLGAFRRLDRIGICVAAAQRMMATAPAYETEAPGRTRSSDLMNAVRGLFGSSGLITRHSSRSGHIGSC